MDSWYLRHANASAMDFANQYYPVLLLQPDLVHKFYSLGSTMILVDGNSINSASDSMFINDDASTYQHQAPIPLGGIFDTQQNSSGPLPEPHGETPVGENVSGSFQSMVNTVHKAPAPAMEESVGEAPKKTYASVLRGSRGQPGPSFSARSSLQRSSPSTSEWNYTPQSAAQHSNSTLSSVPQARLDAGESLHRSSPDTSERNQIPLLSIQTLHCHQCLRLG